MPFPARVISLVKRLDRRECFLRWNGSRQDIEFSFFDAVDGRTLERSRMEAEGLLVPNAPYTAGALGCALSHRALWETAARQEAPLLIFEDDACLQLHFPSVEACLAQLPRDWDFLLLGYNTNVATTLLLPSRMPVSLIFGNHVQRQPGYFEHLSQDGAWSASTAIYPLLQAWGTLAYLVSPRGAERLLQACFPLSSPELDMYPSLHIRVDSLDGMINAGLARGALRGFALFPPIVMGPNAVADSDVVKHAGTTP